MPVMDVPEDARSDAGPVVSVSAPELAVPVERPRAGVVVVRPDGAVDLLTAPQFRLALEEQVAAPTRTLVIDLDGIDFMGSHGVAVLLDTHIRAAELGVHLMVAGGRRTVVRVLELTGLDMVLDRRPSVSHAVRKDV